MQITNIIESLKKLDLSTYPKDEITSLLKQVGEICYIPVSFYRGKIVIRARPYLDGEQRFEKKKDYSFKPQEFNLKYQRASTPKQTMFYATAIPDNPQSGELYNLRVIGAVETIPMLRDTITSGYQKIAFGKWEVCKDIHLLAIIQKDKYVEASRYTKELSDYYQKFIETTPHDIKERSLEFTSFLADEFSKEEIRDDYDYMISAIFSELATQNGLDGVFYPSVRMAGKGFNISITPEATKKLRLMAAGECSIYKKKGQTEVGNDSSVELNGTEEEFKLKDMISDRQECLDQLGVASIDDLK